jgi:hypothetical protein
MSGVLERAASVFVAPGPAGGLRERAHAAAAVLIVWPSAEPPRAALGTPAASRIVAVLQARGLDAVARGRLAWVALSDIGLARRVFVAADVPVVTAVTGPRTAETDALLADQDQVLLIGREEDPLTDLVRASVAEHGVPLVVRAPLTTPGARTTALAGWGRLR